MKRELSRAVVEEVAKVLVNRERETELLLSTFFAEGHALLEGVPGVSKTMLAKSFARSLGLEFRRVQFTPDMLPLDIVGGLILNMKTRELEFRKGPVFTNILLADEINRAPPKVQSALLESMQEGQVTVEGQTERLPAPHMMLATQNPSEFRGVYPLPEGQLDRFMVKITLGYLPHETELEIVKRNIAETTEDVVGRAVSRSELHEAMKEVRSVKVSDEIIDYVARLAEATRSDPRVALGASPRAMIQLSRCARARAFISGRDYVIPDDVKELVPYVFAHRLRMSQSSLLTGDRIDGARFTEELVGKVSPPR
ncbi:MAG: MoxR family ATPase [Nitrososphaerales archaeon]|jgi:MoxR-like ATPase